MKRIRKFRVTICSQEGETEHLILGWHKAWDLAVASLEDPQVDSHISDAQSWNSAILCRFSSRDLNAELHAPVDQPLPMRWRSEKIHTAGGKTRFAYSNITHFSWKWVEGAKRELPFKLSYIERGAERYPYGMLARLVELRNGTRKIIRRS